MTGVSQRVAVVALAALAAVGTVVLVSPAPLAWGAPGTLIAAAHWQPSRPPRPPRRTIAITAGRSFDCDPSFGERYARTLLVLTFGAVAVHLGPRGRELESLYSCFFPHIVRYVHCSSNAGERARNEAGGATCLLHEVPDVPALARAIPGYHRGGTTHLQHEWMSDAMTRWPEYDGYVFAQDDVILNFWAWRAHNASRAWRSTGFPDPDPLVWQRQGNVSLDAPSTEKVVSLWVNEASLPTIRAFVEGFAEPEQRRLFAANGHRRFRMAASDFYYVPARAAPAVAAHLARARRLMVMHEVAVPIVLDAVLEPDDYEEAPGAALWQVTNSAAKMALYDPCWDYFHKMKPTLKREWDFTVDVVTRYGPMLDVWTCGGQGREGLTSYGRLGR